MPISTRIVQVCLFLLAAIALLGGSLQMYLGEPYTTPRLDNVHRFLAGVYFSMGPICIWAAWTIRSQTTLIYLLAFGVFMGAIGRLVSMCVVGLPEPHGLWLGYVTSELVFPIVIAVAHTLSRRKT
ncbi:MAG: DUF4345 domain-containing protein [Spirochaetes bacterium]|nr:DUF4345 domain-containing protein [Spirochaetota bacterium]